MQWNPQFGDVKLEVGYKDTRKPNGTRTRLHRSMKRIKYSNAKRKNKRGGSSQVPNQHTKPQTSVIPASRDVKASKLQRSAGPHVYYISSASFPRSYTAHEAARSPWSPHIAATPLSASNSARRALPRERAELTIRVNRSLARGEYTIGGASCPASNGSPDGSGGEPKRSGESVRSGGDG